MKPLLLIITLTVVLFACKKESKNPTINNNPKSSLLTFKKWQLTAWKVSPAFINGDTDFYASAEPCKNDDYFILSKDSLLTLYENTLKCDPQAPDFYVSKWFLDSDTLYMWGTPNIIITLDENSLKTKSFQKYGSTIYEYNISYKSIP